MQASKPVDSMSGFGGCPRQVVAGRLGYEAVAAPEFMERAAIEGNRHEAWIAEDLKALGWECSKEATCSPCKRNGFHVSIQRPSYNLVGHIDRYASKLPIQEKPITYMAEFKALGRWRAEKLVKSLENQTFKSEFREYAYQVSAYHWATNKPILYAVKNRDTGKLSVFEIQPPFSLEEIDDYILGLELQALKNKLPQCEFKKGDFERTFCRVKYMCEGEGESREGDSVSAVSDAEVASAAAAWRGAKADAESAKARIDAASAILMRAVSALNTRSLSLYGLKLSLIKPSTLTSYPKSKLESIVPEELLSQVRVESERAGYLKIEDLEGK